jgi:hypothetical protein
MNILDQHTISRQDFRRALNIKCYKELGVSLSDLPDIIYIDDVWWEGQTEKEALQMIDSCIDDFKEEMGYEPE